MHLYSALNELWGVLNKKSLKLERYPRCALIRNYSIQVLYEQSQKFFVVHKF
jgi:hypothetical protein